MAVVSVELSRSLLLGWGVVLLCAIPVEAATSYVATNGSDSNPGTLAAPFQTICHGVRSMDSGDALIVYSGTYAEALLPWANCSIKPGLSPSQPTTIQAAPGATVTLRPSGVDYVVFFSNLEHDNQATPAHRYITLDGINMDATNVDAYVIYQRGWTSHITIKNANLGDLTGGQCHLPSYGCGGIFADGANHLYQNLRLHDIGNWNAPPNDWVIGMYVPGDNITIENSEFYRIVSTAVQFWDSSGVSTSNNNTFQNNYVHDVGGDCPCRSVGLYMANGQNNHAYNNIFSNIFSQESACGIHAFSDAVNAAIGNNTIVNLSGSGVVAGVLVDSNPGSSVTIRNNIMHNTGQDIWTDGTATITASQNLTTDPKFLNPFANDFHLTASSPAIDAGLTLSDVTTDFDGISRPQGNASDIGAYEFRVGGALRGDLDGNGTLDLTDVRWSIEMLVGTRSPDLAKADLDGNDQLTLADVQALIRLLVGVP